MDEKKSLDQTLSSCLLVNIRYSGGSFLCLGFKL